MSRRTSAVEADERLLDQAEDALDGGDPLTALQIVEQVLQRQPRHAGAHFIAADALRDLGDTLGARDRYRAVIEIEPEHATSWGALASLAFAELQFEEAGTRAARAIRLDAESAEAYWVRGLLRERRDEHHGAARDFRRANRLDPEAYPMPVPLTDAMVQAVVEEALRTLHPSLREYLTSVAILLEEVPSVETCMHFDPPANPAEILGYYSGVPLTERSIENPWSTLPSAIVLFRRNLSRLAHDSEQLIEELRITLFHEVGHYLGLDEDDLEDRGLE